MLDVGRVLPFIGSSRIWVIIFGVGWIWGGLKSWVILGCELGG